MNFHYNRGLQKSALLPFILAIGLWLWLLPLTLFVNSKTRFWWCQWWIIFPSDIRVISSFYPINVFSCDYRTVTSLKLLIYQVVQSNWWQPERQLNTQAGRQVMVTASGSHLHHVMRYSTMGFICHSSTRLTSLPPSLPPTIDNPS